MLSRHPIWFLPLLALALFMPSPSPAGARQEANAPGKAVEIDEKGVPIGTPSAAPTPRAAPSPALAPAPMATPSVTSGTLALLRTLEAHHESNPTIHAQFKQLRLDAEMLDATTTSGELWFSKPDHFRCDYLDKEDPMTVLIAGLDFYRYTPTIKQADHYRYQSEAERDQQLHLLTIGFGFKPGELIREYDLHSSEDEPAVRQALVAAHGDPAADALIVARPRTAPGDNGAAPFQVLNVYIDKARWLPEKISYLDAGGSTMTLTMDKIDLGSKIDPAAYDSKKIFARGTGIVEREKQ